MSITKKLLPLSMVASILLFTACGGGGNSDTTPPKETNSTNNTTPPKETNSTNETTPPKDSNISNETTPSKDTVSVPEKISIDIPKALKNKRTTDENKRKFSNNSVDENVQAEGNIQADENIQSFGYQQLTTNISEAEDTINSVKENMKYLTLMMPDIVETCANTAQNIKCTIPAGEIELTVEGETIPMGQIFYTKQDESKKYQQVVVLDLKSTLIDMGESAIEKDLETVKWSTDENHIETISDVKDGEDSFNMHLIYDKENSGESTMSITDQYAFDDMKGNFTLKLNDKNDANNTVLVETVSTNKFQEESDSSSSKGMVNSNGGYLISKGSFESEEFAEKESFDATGSLLKSSFCHTGDTCNMNEPDTWKNFDNDEGFIEDFDNNDSFPEDLDLDYQEPLELTFTNVEKFPTYTYCEILPSNYNGDLTEDNIYEKSIGSFARFDDELFGTLLDVDEKDNINTLPVACNNSESPNFFLIPKNIKPTLGIRE